ncbi:MAG: HipA domain-containing protein [Deltaproteobacteria bacterium]|nr:MAG: HipA domain-containing protein [Deltaproteobacteria bacterium]
MKKSYERVARSIRDFVTGEHLMTARGQFFATLVLSVMLRNGDAHLKNFGVLFNTPQSPVQLAPVYDLVTTAVYFRSSGIPGNRGSDADSLGGGGQWTGWVSKLRGFTMESTIADLLQFCGFR